MESGFHKTSFDSAKTLLISRLGLIKLYSSYATVKKKILYRIIDLRYKSYSIRQFNL